MKQVYQVEDGSIHETRASAKEREKLLKSISKVRLLLPCPDDSNCSFANGNGYYQLTAQEINTFRSELRSLIEVLHPDLVEVYDQNSKGVIGRYLCDSDSPLRSLQYVLSCISDNNRLWGQPYFACNPGQGKQVNLK